MTGRLLAASHWNWKPLPPLASFWRFLMPAVVKTLSLGLPADGPRIRVLHAAVTNDGKLVLALYSDGRLRVWNVADAKVTTSFPAEKLVGVSVSANGKWVAVSGTPTVLLWKLP